MKRSEFKRLVKFCIAEVIVEGNYDQLGFHAPNNLHTFLRQMGYRWNENNATYTSDGKGDITIHKDATSTLTLESRTFHFNNLNDLADFVGHGINNIDKEPDQTGSYTIENLIKECIIEVLKEDLTEAFDPTSQGPNPVEENPYVRWNAHMRKLEESTTDPKKKEKIQKMIQKAEAWVAKKKSQGWTQKDFAAGLKKMLTKENEHGRYAQNASAGQFDPRTFGVNGSN